MNQPRERRKINKRKFINPIYPSILEDLSLIKNDFYEILKEQDLLNYTETQEILKDIIRMYFSLIDIQIIDNILENKRKSSLNKIKEILDCLERAEKVLIEKNNKTCHSQACINEFILDIVSPRLDRNVTIQAVHLLKGPFCVHPDTGFISVPMSLEMLEKFDLKKIPIVHMGSSVSMLTHPKQPFTTGVRMGIAIYGYNVAPDSLSNSPKDKLRKMRNDYFIKKYNISETYFDVKIDLQPAMKMKTRILQLKKVNKGEWFGYNASYTADEDIILAILPVGYNNGIGHANHGRRVVINGKKYPVVGEMCMNMTAIKVDSSVKIDDEVTLLGDGITVGMFGRSSGMGNAEALVNIGKNNPRFYVKDGKVVKEK